MIYLDTHVVTSLFKGEPSLLSEPARQALEDNDEILVSPAVLLELEYLHEARLLKNTGASVVETLAGEIGLRVCEQPFALVTQLALREKWSRDLFDRLIVAQARTRSAPLLTADPHIHRHYFRALW